MVMYAKASAPVSISSGKRDQPKFYLDQVSIQVLPLWVAQQDGFQRLWAAGKVQVSTSPNLTPLITSIPASEISPATSWTLLSDKPAALIAGGNEANGYAVLDNAAKISVNQLPSSIMQYQGVYNATTNTPALVDGTGDSGDVYRVSVAGTRNFGSGNVTLRVGDYVIYNGTIWQKSATTDNVASVAGLAGDITSSSLKTALSLDQVSNTSDASKPISTATQTALDGKLGTTATAAASTKLATARAINGVSFDGTADINPVSSATVGHNWYPNAYISGNYYYCNSSQSTNTANNLGNGTIRVFPWVVTQSVTVTRLFAEFTVAGDANSIFRMGIWNHDLTTGKPSTLVVDAGSISTGSGNAGTVATGGTTGVYEVSINSGTGVVLSPGLYWVGGAVQGVTTTQPTMRSVQNNTISIAIPLGTSLPGTNQTIFGFLLTGQTGSLGSLATAVIASGTSNPARIGFKVA